MSFEEFLTKLSAWALETGLKLLSAVVILIISFRIITVTARRLEKRLLNGKRHLDKTLTNTLFYLGKIILKFVIAACLVGYVGIDTSGIGALITSLGVCVGLAVNGALSNLAGGVIILITRPFRVDDYIETQGYGGTVEDIHIVTTRLRTPDNKVVYIPNGIISSGTIVNYSEKNIRRIDKTFRIPYTEKIDRVKEIILEILSSNEKILKEPPPSVRASSIEENGISILARCWVENEDFWDVNFDVLEAVKARFDEEKVIIPFNQLDVHIKE